MKRKFFTSLAAAAVLACTIVTASATAKPQASVPYRPAVTVTVPSASLSAQEQKACELVNQIRRQKGLKPLTIDAGLASKARIKSSDMKQNRYFSHNSPTYGSPFSMMKQLGISYKSAGENIAMGFSSANAVVNAWMSSAGHRENILSGTYTTMGIGYVDGYWTQWFIR